MTNPYFFPGTTVLRNRLQLRDPARLHAAEAELVTLSYAALKAKPLKLPFGSKRLCATHKALFGQLYDWGGQFRQNMPRMSKQRADGSVISYGPSDNVPAFLESVFAQLQAEQNLTGLACPAFAVRGAFFYGELDAAHPFADGNSRTIRTFMADLAQAAGHDLDWDRVSQTEADRQAFYHARDEAVRGRLTELEGIFRLALGLGKQAAG